MARPSPLPPLLPWRQKRRVRCGRSVSAMPGPWSRTWKRAQPCAVSTASSTRVPAAVWRRALSSRLRSAAMASTEGTSSGASDKPSASFSSNIRTSPWPASCMATRAASSALHCTPSSNDRLPSTRASSNSWSSVRCRRSAPSSAWARACSAAAPSVMRATCRWVLIAVSGLRSSWAASPVRRRSRSMAWAMRWNNWFWVSTSGFSSLGRAASSSGSSESAPRRVRASRIRLSGARPWPAPSQSRARLPSRATVTGTAAATTTERCSTSRSSRRSAVLTRRSPACTVKLRHSTPLISWSRKPLAVLSSARSGVAWLCARTSPRSELTWQAMPLGIPSCSALRRVVWPSAGCGCGNCWSRPATIRAEAARRWSKERIICPRRSQSIQAAASDQSRMKAEPRIRVRRRRRLMRRLRRRAPARGGSRGRARSARWRCRACAAGDGCGR
ncbi:Uncharacterised protein [Klebsiella pneumoniae]|nr:Uncharacterised protein [Klebsiella pneumoniae]